MNDYPNQYQFYTLDTNNELLHCAPHGAPRMSKKAAIKQERKWQQWRREYIASHPGDYPLAQQAKKSPALIIMHPIDDPKNRVYIHL